MNFDESPPDFGAFEREMAAPMRPYGLEKAKVALRRNYPIASNWKLSVENYCECYHCQPAHPEYSVAHGRAIPRAECDVALAEVMAKAPSVGLTQHLVNRSWLHADSSASSTASTVTRSSAATSREAATASPLRRCSAASPAMTAARRTFTSGR